MSFITSVAVGAGITILLVTSGLPLWIAVTAAVLLEFNLQRKIGY